MRARNLEVVRVSAERVVLQNGPAQLLVSGAAAADLAESLVGLLEQVRDMDELLVSVPEQHRANAEQLINALSSRRMIELEEAVDDRVPEERGRFSQLRSLFTLLGAEDAAAAELMGAATVEVRGRNAMSAAVIGGLLDVGVGEVSVVADPVLDVVDEQTWLAKVAEQVGEDEARQMTMSCTPKSVPALHVALCDQGFPDALLRANREAVDARRPFLPAWVLGSSGYVGPVVVPGETACLRCATLLDPPSESCCGAGDHSDTFGVPQSSRATANAAAALVGSVVVLEVIKFVVGHPPSDAIGRRLRIDTLSFRGEGRRVLKLPRCPDCSDLARHGLPAVLLGPQIPMRWVGLHA